MSTLAHTAEFLHIRPALEAVGRELDQSIAQDEKALSVIANASREYHEAVLRSMKGRTEGALNRLEYLEQAARPPDSADNGGNGGESGGGPGGAGTVRGARQAQRAVTLRDKMSRGGRGPPKGGID